MPIATARTVVCAAACTTMFIGIPASHAQTPTLSPDANTAAIVPADAARALLAKPQPDPVAALALLSLDCPMGSGATDPACVDSYLLSLQANAEIDGHRDANRLPPEWYGDAAPGRIAMRDAQWLTWLGPLAAAAPFDPYRLAALRYFEEAGDFAAAQSALKPFQQRRDTLPATDQAKLRYLDVQLWLATSRDRDASNGLRAIEQIDGTVDPAVLEYAARLWFVRAPAELDAWRAQLPAPWPPLLDWRAAPPVAGGSAQVVLAALPASHAASPYASDSDFAAATGKLRLFVGERMSDWPFATDAASQLLTARPHAALDATQWWDVQNLVWHAIRTALPALPDDTAALAALAGDTHAQEALLVVKTADHRAPGNSLLERQIQLQLAERAPTGAARATALLAAEQGNGDATRIYRLADHDPAMFEGLSTSNWPPQLLLVAVQSYEAGTDDTQRAHHRMLGRRYSDAIPDLSIDGTTSSFPHSEFDTQHNRIDALLQLDEPREASRIALRDLQQIHAHPDLNENWTASALADVVHVIRYFDRYGGDDDARVLACAARPLAGGSGTNKGSKDESSRAILDRARGCAAQ
ncbi:hypothetical protein [Paraburkholderia sp.]|uniref:hypothetical protein n=1 Tax=Paraburkholderia sp. TaxID=1926495 RepID=UPI003D6DE12A